MIGFMNKQFDWFPMRRRELLRVTGATITAGVGVTGTTAASSHNDLDPRPAAGCSGTLPSEDVPTMHTGALPDQPTSINTGQWIRHRDVWNGGHQLHEMLNSSIQTFKINGERFVLDSVEDWEIKRRVIEGSVGYTAIFEYITPPQSPGTTYEVTWNFELKEGAPDDVPSFEGIFPISNRVRVLPGGNGNGKQ